MCWGCMAVFYPIESISAQCCPIPEPLPWGGCSTAGRCSFTSLPPSTSRPRQSQVGAYQNVFQRGGHSVVPTPRRPAGIHRVFHPHRHVVRLSGAVGWVFPSIPWDGAAHTMGAGFSTACSLCPLRLHLFRAGWTGTDPHPGAHFPLPCRGGWCVPRLSPLSDAAFPPLP